MRKNIEERVTDLERKQKEDRPDISILQNRIERLETILEGLGYYIPTRKP